MNAVTLSWCEFHTSAPAICTPKIGIDTALGLQLAVKGGVSTTMGYDLNYAEIIFGREISYDKKKNDVVIFKDYYYDTIGKIDDSHTALPYFSGCASTYSLPGAQILRQCRTVILNVLTNSAVLTCF